MDTNTQNNKNIFTILKKNIIFSLLDDETLEKLRHLFIEKSYKLGEVILRQNEPVNDFHIIIKGKARVIDQINNTSLTTLSTGDCFGERAIISGTNAIASVRASGKLTVYKMSQKNFVEQVLSIPEIKKHLTEYSQLVEKYISLKSLSIFSSLTTDQVRKFIDTIESVKIKAGEYLYHKDEHADAVYIIRSGKIRIVKEDTNRTLAIRKAGDILGEISIVKSRPYIASGLALENSVLYKISQKTFNDILPDIQDSLEDIVAKKLLQHETFDLDHSNKENIIYPEFKTEKYIFSQGLSSKEINCVTVNHPSLSGMACIKMILDAKTISLPDKWNQRTLGQIENEQSNEFDTISRFLEEVGVFTRKIRIKPENIKNDTFPAIIMDEENIPQVFFDYKSDIKIFVCCHPIKGLMRIPYKEFISSYNSEILLVKQIPDFRESSKKLMSAFWQFVNMLLQYKDLLFWIIVVSIILMLFGLSAPYFTQIIADRVLLFNDIGLLKLMLTGSLLIAFFTFIADIFRKFLTITIFQRIETTVSTAFFDHILQLQVQSYEKYNIGDYVTRFGENRKLINLFSDAGLTLTFDVFFACFYIISLFLQNLTLTFAGLSFVVFEVFFLVLSSKKIRQFEIRGFHAEAENTSFMIKMLTGIQSVKSIAGEKNFLYETMNKLSKKMLIEYESECFVNRLSILTHTFSRLSTIAILLLGTYKVINQEMTVGEYLSFNAIFGLLMGPISSLSGMWDQLQETRISLDRINDIWKLPIEERLEYRDLSRIKGHILLENINFRYKSTDSNVLSNINLEILPGTKVALVGRSGCGKSTLINLIMGFIKPDSGKIYVDNIDCSSINQSSLMSQIGLVEQKTVLFSGTIKENIAKSDPNISDEKIISAASISGVKEFTDRLPLGLETRIGEGGAGLSGGQIQRIVIARAIIREPKILILDEATSSLDTESEMIIQKNIDAIMEGRTTICIAHRLSTIINSDLIVVLDNGAIVEKGTHDELIKNKGLYFYLFTSGQ